MKYIFCFYVCFINLFVAGSETSFSLPCSGNFETGIPLSFNSFDDSQKEVNDVNYLLNQADRYMFRDFQKSLNYAKQASLLAAKKGDSEKKALAYYYIVRNLFFHRELKESYSYIEKGMKEEAVKTNPLYKILFTEATATYYGLISLPNKQLEEEMKVLKMIPIGKGTDSKILEANTYMAIGDAYTDMANYKSAHVYADKSIDCIEKIPEKDYLNVKRIYWRKAYIYFYKAWIYLQENKPKEAYPFIKKAYDQSVREDLAYSSPFLEIYGDYYFQIGNYHKSIEYYLKTMDNKAKLGHSAEYVQSKIASAYRILGDHDKEKVYLKKSTDQFKKTTSEDRLRIQEGLENIKKEQEQKITEAEKENKIILASVVVIAIIILVLALVWNRKLKKKKRAIIKEKENQLQHKNTIITEREDTIEKLQLQVNESFSELIQMAKENSPQFFARFQEVYPEVYEKMLKINPKVKVPELTFAAYLYLGFSTKQIATYTWVTIHAVEIRKTRFRKKYNIPSDIDCNIWMKNLVK